jgi:hypothetical protein
MFAVYLRTIPVATDVKHVRIYCLSVVSITMQSAVSVRSGGRLFSHHPSAASKARPFFFRVGSVLAAPQCCTTSCRTSATCIISNVCVCVWGGGGGS